MKKNRLTYYIFIAMALGVIAGYAVHQTTSFSFQQSFSQNIKLLGTIFIRLVRAIIAPLVFSTLVVGIAKMGDLKTVGRVGGKALLWFIAASLASLLLGMLWVNFFHPGTYINLSQADTAGLKDLIGKNSGLTLQKFIEHLVPASIVEAMADNEILQIVVFSVFFGIAAAALGDVAKPVIKALEALSHIVLKIVNYIMAFAPFAVFGTLAAVVAEKGLSVFTFYTMFFLYYAIGIISLLLLHLLAGQFILKRRMKELMQRIASPLLIAFSTTSSEAVFPKLTEELENFGCKNQIVSFVLPLGYSFNLAGSMMYMSFASIAIAQAYGINLSLSTQLTMLLVLMVTSKGVAGVPRSGLIMVLATCAMFKIPPEGVALILPIDHFCDMLRSAINVLGNALATSAVSKWEGSLNNKLEDRS